jgi:hypothetical protein
MRISRAAAALVVAALLPAGFAAAGDAPSASPLAGADAKSRIALAQELKKKDVAALAKALSELGASKTKDVDREFLEQYALSDRDRATRLVALEALARLDRKGASDWFKAHADGKDMLATVVSLEALGYLGTKDDAASAIELIKNPDEIIAVAAASAAARLATAKDVEAIAEIGLAHASDHVTDHAAWAVQDVVKKLKAAVEVFEKFAGKKSDPKAIRAASTVASLQDKRADPQVWGDSLKAAAELVAKAPATIEIKCQNADWKANAVAALDWLKKNMPAAELMLRAAAKHIDIPGVKHPDDWVDIDNDAILIPADRAAWKPNALALHLFWTATVVWEHRVGEPCKGHRGWDVPIFDSYDLCVIARLYDAGQGGLPRSTFVKDQIQKHPWGSN